MPPEPPESDAVFLDRLAERSAFSRDAIAHLQQALVAGAGDMAMFDHADFAGPGQWMRGGLLMISAPQDTELKRRIDQLCHELSERIRETPLSAPPAPDTVFGSPQPAADAAWWPAELGVPDATGRADDFAYAWFRAPQRLALREAGHVTLHDTGGAEITGISQRQTGTERQTVFTTPNGPLVLGDLPRAGDDSAPVTTASKSQDAIFTALERLAELRDKGVLTEAEFTAQKQTLLARL